jgi:hypothetical protein
LHLPLLLSRLGHPLNRDPLNKGTLLKVSLNRNLNRNPNRNLTGSVPSNLNRNLNRNIDPVNKSELPDRSRYRLECDLFARKRRCQSLPRLQQSVIFLWMKRNPETIVIEIFPNRAEYAKMKISILRTMIFSLEMHQISGVALVEVLEHLQQTGRILQTRTI